MADPMLPAGLDLRFEVIDLIHRIGAHRTEERIVRADEQVGSPVMGVAAGDPIDVRAQLESVEEGIFITGSADATLTGECSRCLDPITEDVSAPIGEMFTYPDKLEKGIDPEEDDIPLLTGDTIDLGHQVHDALAVAAPFTPLCREDCLGLCDQCGFRMEDDPDHEHVIIDPRLSSLAALLQDSDGAAGDAKGDSAQ
ncbi:YceD family protein [Helcobacillus massiliensis]|uniref:DUF177 domain-containing protein n=1 Tax=Helcobacillus massiliensis TaxID=521392 RepID=A0A839QTT5_9MICO|nr:MULTISPECIES: YceD family protein [Helcobacillus]MBB3022180.1 uncharacterized protein [Helcobacillus massiliensis]MCG7426755.1 YceD family protein [Helcobacillus sp. ACRRO]MCT1557295.1 YceD family protein [Helcobacillus massiliensis]MCT2036226.1 YceD family protein [Helcobacillus massiliensis]MCT2331580.1 YceD family protein [Helcobacillus massiliensis]